MKEYSLWRREPDMQNEIVIQNEILVFSICPALSRWVPDISVSLNGKNTSAAVKIHQAPQLEKFKILDFKEDM